MKNLFKGLYCKLSVVAFLLTFLNLPLTAQQWFLRDFDASTNITNLPDYKTAGTSMAPDDASVLVYGTMGYTNYELSGGDGGFGNADVIILNNDLDGNNLWAITFGTINRDVASRVNFDSNGDIVISGYTVESGVRQVFVAKIQVINNGGGSYSFNLLWSKKYGEGTPTDMINSNVNNSSVKTTDGYVVIGWKGNDAFAMRINMSGGSAWKNYYTSSTTLRFNAALQPRSLMSQGQPSVYASEFVVAGRIGSNAYLAALNKSNGNIRVQLNYADIYVNNCSGHQNPSNFVSIDQAQGNDFTVFGESGGDNIHLVNINFLAGFTGFTVAWDRVFSGGQPSMHGQPYDMNVTAYGYIGIFFYSGTSYKPLRTVEYDTDGTIIRFDELANYTNWNMNFYLHNEDHQVSAQNQYPLFDFDMECGKAMHLSGTESIVPNAPPGWALDKVPHKRLRLNSQGDCLEQPLTMPDDFCDDFLKFATGPVASKAGNMPELTLSADYSQVGTPKTDICESICPRSACVATIVHIIEDGDFITLDAVAGFDQYFWTTGSNEISVVVQPFATTSYSVDMVDANGCVTTIMYTVYVLPGRKKSPSLLGDEAAAANISMYPNPTKGAFKLELPQDDLTVQIMDLTGKLIFRADNLNEGIHDLNLEGYDNGMYIVRVTGAGLDESFKLAKF